MRRLFLVTTTTPTTFLGVLKMSVSPSIVAVETDYGEVTRVVVLDKEFIDVRSSEGVDVVIRRRPGEEEDVRIVRMDSGYAMQVVARALRRLPSDNDTWRIGYAYTELAAWAKDYEVVRYDYEKPELPRNGLAVTALETVENILNLLSLRRVNGPELAVSTVFVDGEAVMQVLRMLDSVRIMVRAGRHVVIVPQASCPCEPAAVVKSAQPAEIRHYELVDAILEANRDLVPLGTMVTEFLDANSEDAKKALGRLQGTTFI